MRAGHFEEVEVWKDACQLARAVYRRTERGPFARDEEARNQVRRCAFAVVSNVAEGFERGTPGELIRFLQQANNSAGELCSRLHFAADIGYLRAAGEEPLVDLATAFARQLGDVLRHLKNLNN